MVGRGSEAIAIAPTRNPGGVYSDSAGGPQFGAYTIKSEP